MILFTQLTPHGAYASHVLPGLLLTGVGMGCIFAPAFSTATLGVKSHDAGIASAMVNTSQQVGGSVGTALLSTIFASAAASFVSAHAKHRRSRQRGLDPRLHDRVRVGSRAVRSRTARGAADPSLGRRQTRPGRASRNARRPDPQPRNDMTLPSAAAVANPRRRVRAQPKEYL